MYENLIKDLLLEQYSLVAEQLELISHSNKMVYKVILSNKEQYMFDLFVKKEQEDTTSNDENNKYYTPEAIASEARIQQILNENYPELKSPSPVRNKDGQLLSLMTLNGISTQCLLRNFIPGVELTQYSPEYANQAYGAGVVAAKLHQCSINHMQNEYSKRPVHRQQHVLKIINTIERGIEVGTITPAQYTIVKDALSFIIQRMDEMDQNPEYIGIVHTDLRDANLLTDGENVIPIDFGRCIYGYHLYDIGEMCAHMGGEGSIYCESIIKGYHSIRKLSHFDIVAIEGFKMLFILSVVAEFILQTENSYVYDTLKRLTENDLVHLLAGEPVIPTIRSVIE
ncbi:phosphotransferase enzyme family protein [Paenibacillus sp. OV219]|uniref:phosphotransferase enzyme family protein n=1 Tax=Paenibacillus sp. OV219 TaxID=1884377 RepID=UPI0008AE4DD7|nr:phosphotransferase [Paenibacillus sp. OV219]SEO82640.1 Phosphotransferase enzyme family protein [Paenibacillus sp. OV219]